MPFDRDVIEAVRDMDEHELRRLLMLAAARLEKTGVQLPADNRPEVRYRSQFVRCGKANCSSCPHGPYWYAHWRENGKRKSRYLGRLQDLGDDVRVQDHRELLQ